MSHSRPRARGFSFVEMLVAVAVFTVIAGASFQLLNVAQQRFRTDSEVLDSFQAARMGLDQIIRDVTDSGFPPANFFLLAPPFQTYASTPFAYSPGYPNTPCTIGGSCTSPNGFDLIVETDIDPQNNNGVEWIRYQLVGTTLMRGVTSKVAGQDPADPKFSGPAMTPYVENVMNNATPAQIAQIQASYPKMFPGNAPVPIFAYSYDTPTTPQQPPSIREVDITLIVQAAQADAQTGQPRLVELNGLARRINPNH